MVCIIISCSIIVKWIILNKKNPFSVNLSLNAKIFPLFVCSFLLMTNNKSEKYYQIISNWLLLDSIYQQKFSLRFFCNKKIFFLSNFCLYVGFCWIHTISIWKEKLIFFCHILLLLLLTGNLFSWITLRWIDVLSIMSLFNPHNQDIKMFDGKKKLRRKSTRFQCLDE